MKKFLRSKKGFTLVELLVVVAIIVALAAVVVPNIARFTSKGTTGGANSEVKTLQTAMDAAITDNSLGSVYARNNVSNFSSAGGAGLDNPATIFLYSNYLRTNTATYGPYCWSTAGLVEKYNDGVGLC